MIVSQLAWPACSINATSVSFGAYDTFSNQDTGGTGNISVNCDAGVAYSISLSSGSGSYALRTMRSGADALGYNLYTDPPRYTIWGDGAGATATVGGTGSGTAVSIPVYGRIPARQNVRAGLYADTIVVTVAF